MPFALRHDRAPTQRLFWLKNAYDHLERELTNAELHWLVHMMAVRPEQQGRGVGSELLAHGDATRGRAVFRVGMTRKRAGVHGQVGATERVWAMSFFGMRCRFTA